MSKNLFVTGTGTEVGKTFVTALILKKLQESGKKAGYFKAAMSGNLRDQEQQLIPGDAAYVQKISGIQQSLAEMCPYIYENAYSPHLAAQVEGRPVQMQTVKNCFEALSQKYEYLTMEGSGGIVCPIRFDQEKIQLEDIIQELGLSCILVAEAGLGTINQVVLTVEYLRARKIPVKGLIFNRFHPDNLLETDNLKMCEYFTGLKTLACLPENASELDLRVETLISLYD